MMDVLPIDSKYLKQQEGKYTERKFKIERNKYQVEGMVMKGYYIVNRVGLLGIKKESYLVSTDVLESIFSEEK